MIATKTFVSISDTPSRCLCVKPALITPALHQLLRVHDAFEFLPLGSVIDDEFADPAHDMPVLVVSWPKFTCLRFQSLN